MNRKTRYLLIGIFLAVSQAQSFAADDGHDEQSSALKMNAEQRRANGIETQRLAPRGLAEEVTAPGEVQLNAYTSAQVTPRIAAQIVQRHARLGDEIKAGMPLVMLSSVEMAEAQGALMLADAEWNRVQKLGKDVVSERRYVETQTARQLANAKVIAYGMSLEQVEQLLRGADPARADGSFVLHAPIGGRVVRDEFTLGEKAEAGRVLFEIADERTMWVDVRVAPDLAASIAPGTPLRMLVGKTWLSGRVVQSRHRLDVETRMFVLRAEVDNKKDLLHPGQFVEARLQASASKAALAVPAEAVVLIQTAPTVFKLEGDELQPQNVETGVTKGGWTEIKGGLVAGDEIVIKGMFALKSRMLKSQLGEGH